MDSRSKLYGTLSGGLLLIGVGLIFLFKMDLFPAILAVLGLSSILAGLATGRGWEGLQGGLWLIGLFFLFQFDIFWPGILIVLGVSALIGAFTRTAFKRPEGESQEKSEK